MTDHVCQLFDSHESLADTVSLFLADGLLRGEYVIAVCRPALWTSIAANLEACGIRVEQRISEGQLAVSDAATTLAALCPRGRLNGFAFNERVGALVQSASGRRIRAWGEMVDILVERGDFDEALELEELWNRVGEMVPLTLMCSYMAAHFVAGPTHRGLRELCMAHTDVRRDPQDALANWVLTTAHHAGGSSSLH